MELEVINLLNIILGIVLVIMSLYYYFCVGGWLPLATAILGAWIAGIYVFRCVGIPSIISHQQFGLYVVRPAFTLTLILMTAKAVAGVARIR